VPDRDKYKSSIPLGMIQVIYSHSHHPAMSISE